MDKRNILNNNSAKRDKE